MAVESDADLLGMFDTFDFAVTATWLSRDGGPPVEGVPVLLDVPESTVLGQVGARAAAPMARVPAASLPCRPRKGDLLAVGAAGDYRVEMVDRDPIAPIWLLTLVRA